MDVNVIERAVRDKKGHVTEKYYTRLKHASVLPEESFAQAVSERHSMPSFWVNAVLEATASYVFDQVSRGHVVEVPFWGRFKILAQTSVADQRCDAGIPAVNRLRLNFLPTRKILDGILPEKILKMDYHGRR